MSDWDLSRLTRRRFVVASAMGLSSASLAGVAPAQASGTGDHPERGTGGLAGAVAVVDAVLVEGGNSLYQGIVDRYVAGLPVQNADLCQVWRNSTNSPLATGDEPITEHFYRTIRAVNWRLPAGDRIRVLLGDPPIDWPKMTAPDQVFAFRAQSDAFAASLVKREVLDKGGRALICYGSGHVFHAAAKTNIGPPGVVPLLEQQTGERVYSIASLAPLAGDAGGLGGRLSPLPARISHPDRRHLARGLQRRTDLSGRGPRPGG